MKKRLVILLALFVAIGAQVGCSAKDSSRASDNEATGTVVIAGSTSVQPLSEELAAAFMDANLGISVEVQGGGSGQGIKAIQEKIADLGALSRNVKDEEKASLGNEFVIAKDGVVVIVNKSVKVDNLTIAQIKGIYTGEIKNWSEVGGENLPIVVVTREEGSGTRSAFIEITGVLSKDSSGKENDGTTKEALVQGSSGAVLQTVASTPNTIGYISLGALNDSIKAIKVENITPSIESVLSGEYKISRPFIYVVAGELSEAAQMYVDFVLSPEGQKIIEESGFIPVE